MHNRTSSRHALFGTAIGVLSGAVLIAAAGDSASAQNLIFPPGTECNRLLDTERQACIDQARRAQQQGTTGAQGVTIPNNSITANGPNNAISPNTANPASANPVGQTGPDMSLSPNSTNPGRVIEPNSTSPGQATSPNSTSPNGMTPDPTPAIITPNGTSGTGGTTGGGGGGSSSGSSGGSSGN